MNDYDFSCLNDEEFEVLCADLIGAAMSVRFERFKRGRDQGVDGRYTTTTGAEWILQAKHRPGSTLPQLVTHVRNLEAPKMAALNPERYILAVSHSLSRLNKDELAEALRSCATCPVEVYGREDLNDLLAHHEAIERRHFKLWISSTNVLNSMLNNAINGRSKAVLHDIADKSKLFVQTTNFDAAAQLLIQFGTVIITGEPGIGKTTLAEQLILHYASDEFELVCISDDVEEAENAYNEDIKQVFFFDDFLGRNYLHALDGHEGSQIVRFIKRIARDRVTKKLILTSRSTILNQGRLLNDVFVHNKTNKNEMEIRIESLSNLNKARILYNHIWHSRLSPAHAEQFYLERRYWKVISHRNFNPRLIQFITDPQRSEGIEAKDYWRYVQGMLANPEDIWEHPFNAQLDDFGRFMVLLVAFNGPRIHEDDLADAYAKGLEMPGYSNYSGQREFYFTAKHLTNSMLVRVLNRGKVFYKLFNPSLGDFLLRRYAKNFRQLAPIFKSLRSRSALDVIIDMDLNDLVNRTTTDDIILTLFEHEESLGFKGSPPDYLSKLYLCAAKILPGLAASGASATNESAARFTNVVNAIITSPITDKHVECIELVARAAELKLVGDDDILTFVNKAINYRVDKKELPALGNLIAILESNGIDDASEPFLDYAHQLVLNRTPEFFDEGDVFSQGDNYSLAQKQLESMIKSSYSSWKLEPTDEMIDEIVDAFDISERMANYFEVEDEQYSSPRAAQNWQENKIIDQLFSRVR